MTFLSNILNGNYAMTSEKSMLRNVGHCSSGGSGRGYVCKANLQPGTYRLVVGNGVRGDGTNGNAVSGVNTSLQRYDNNTEQWVNLILCGGGTKPSSYISGGTGGTITIDSSFESSIKQVIKNTANNGSYQGSLGSGLGTKNPSQNGPLKGDSNYTEIQQLAGGCQVDNLAWKTCVLASTYKSAGGYGSVTKSS